MIDKYSSRIPLEFKISSNNIEIWMKYQYSLKVVAQRKGDGVICIFRELRNF